MEKHYADPDLNFLPNLDDTKGVSLYSNPYNSDIPLPLSSTSRFLSLYRTIPELPTMRERSRMRRTLVSEPSDCGSTQPCPFLGVVGVIPEIHSNWRLSSQGGGIFERRGLIGSP